MPTLDSSNHNWKVADDQSNTGSVGVRVYCATHQHAMTVHRDLLENYL